MSILLKPSIRQACVNDIELLPSFMIEHGRHPWNYLEEIPIKEHIAQIRDHTLKAYVAEIGKRYIGLMCFREGIPFWIEKYEKNPRLAAYITEVVVHQYYQKMGLASQLLAKVKQDLLGQGIERLYADRNTDNRCSAAWMTRNDFEIIDAFNWAEHQPPGAPGMTIVRLNLSHTNPGSVASV